MKIRFWIVLLLGIAPAHGAEVSSSGGVTVQVASSAQHKLQCVVTYLETNGCKVRFMRGIGHGTVRHSLHPSGRAIDTNQTSRNVVRSCPSRSLSIRAAVTCGALSGASWVRSPDNGHFQTTGGTNDGVGTGRSHYRGSRVNRTVRRSLRGHRLGYGSTPSQYGLSY
jgi:hypothetical protein